MREIKFIRTLKNDYDKFKSRDLTLEDVCGYVGGVAIPIIGFEIVLLWLPKVI